MSADPEVRTRGKHRNFSSDEKARILAEYEAAGSSLVRCSRSLRKHPARSRLLSPLLRLVQRSASHVGIALLTPADVHHGRIDIRRDGRRRVLHNAFALHPKRFVRGRPEPPALADVVFINRPNDSLQAA